MAITWKVTITPTNLTEERARVSGVRSEDGTVLGSYSFAMLRGVGMTNATTAR